MNKTELIASIAQKTGAHKKDVAVIVAAALDTVAESLSQGEAVQLVGFGTFEVKKRAARVGRNPKTNELMEIPASKFPSFKPGKAMKDAVSGK